MTVALNGDGGDEVFGGYLRFYGGHLSERFPRWAWGALRAGLALLPEPRDRKHPLRFAKRFAEAGERPLLERYLRWNAYFTDDLEALLRPELRAHAGREAVMKSFEEAVGRDGSVLARLLELNFNTYLLDDLNVKMDRMSMARALETRSPFLDTALVEFGASLPDRLRMLPRQGKAAPAAGHEGRAASQHPGAGQDGLRRAARRLVPGRAGALRRGAPARSGKPGLRVPREGAGGPAGGRAT